MTREKKLQKQIREALARQGYYTVKLHGGGYQLAGLPDILALSRGNVMFIETKVARTKKIANPLALLSPRQRMTFARLSAYVKVFVVVADVMLRQQIWIDFNTLLRDGGEQK